MENKKFHERWAIKSSKEVGEWLNKVKKEQYILDYEKNYRAFDYIVYPDFDDGYLHDFIPEGYTEITIEQFRENYKTNPDNVNHPKHYTDGKIEVIDFIEDKGLNFHKGNVVKYVVRAGKKDPSKEIEDLKKALWYLNREINRLKNDKR
jgi:hypothetical protein